MVSRPLLAQEIAMLVLRLIGWLLILAALAVLLYDAWGWHQTGAWRMIPAGQLWFDLDRSSLNLAQAAIERHVWRFLWFPVISTILQWPAAAVLGVPGIVLVLIGRRRPPIGRRRIFFRK
jgi:hypothetical protein